MNKYLILLSAISTLMISCHTHEHESDGHDHEIEIPTVDVTQWTEKMELFMEYDTPVAGNEIKFIIHLTTMADFQPVRDGKVTLYFEQPGGSSIKVEKDDLLREGIFTPVQVFEEAAAYHFRISYTGKKAVEAFDIGTFNVYPTLDDVPEQEDGDAEEITYLKEQQWKTEFATEIARRRPVKSSVKAIGDVQPLPANYAEIISPVEGILSIEAADKLVRPGQTVHTGQTLAVIVPPLVSENSWAKIYLEYEQSKAEFERAQRLKEKKAISDREFEQARRYYEMNKAGFSNYFNIENGGIRFDPDNNQFQITAPVSGIVSDVTVLPGQKVDRNQTLFSIIDPEKVWLKLELFSDQAANLADISGVSIKIPGKNERINLPEREIIIISRGEIIDPQKRTIKVLLETNNKDRRFLIGQTFSADIYTSPDRDMLTIPLSAVFDDKSRKVTYVHTSGESFEKRILETGPVYNNYVAVLQGLEEGERIVNRGGYLVKLASTSEEIGHPHAH